MLKDIALFFAYLRKTNILGPTLSQKEVDGCQLIVTSGLEAKWPISWVAYALATAYHETAHTMEPIHEMGGSAYLTRMYDISGNRPDLAKANGNTKKGDGALYYGRGFVQLTWKVNYAKAETKCKIPGLLANPDLALLPVNAAKILISGMGEGWFSGKSCATYLPATGPATTAQFIPARKIINGSDRAELVAGYAIEFQKALLAADY